MKKSIIFVLAIFISLNLSAQETVSNKTGKQVTVNNDATSGQKGSVKLTGDLGGTADAPTVPALSSKIDGTGTINFIPKFTANKSLGNSLLFDSGTYLGLGTISPGNKFEITQGTAGNSGLRFTNLNSASTATTSSSKVLGLNSSGDVILINVPGTQNIVDFSTATPTTVGVVFTPNTPADESVVYQSAVDNSMWTYNGTTYVTYTAPASTAWFTAGTTNDAGNSKTSNIYRTGNVGVKNNNPSAPLVVQGVTGTGALKLVAPSVAAGDNWWLGFGHGTTSTDANDRARIGVDIAGGGAGRLFFTTGSTGTQTRAMFIDESQRVGIGTSSPTSRLVIRGLNNAVSTLGTAQTNAIFRVEGESNHSLDMGTLTASPYGSYIQSHNKASVTALPLNLNPVGGNVGIGTSNPISKLEVNGSATNTTAFNASASSTINFDNSNLAYTTANAGAFIIQGMKDGGTYTLAVQGSTSGTASFSGSNPSSTAFTFLSVNNGATIAGKQTLYTFIVMGTTVYFYMATGF